MYKYSVEISAENIFFFTAGAVVSLILFMSYLFISDWYQGKFK